MSHPLGSVRGIAAHPVLEAFTPAVREWFAASFPTPTPPQIQGWPHIVAGEHTLICAPTGSGKTLTAFLASIDRLTSTPPPEDKSRHARIRFRRHRPAPGPPRTPERASCPQADFTTGNTTVSGSTAAMRRA